MSFEHIQFVSGWTVLDAKSMVMAGRKATLEIENNGGDFLIFEYAYPGGEEETSVSVTLRIFDQKVGQFRGYYSFPFFIGFKIPSFSQRKLSVTLETDHSYLRLIDKGERREYGLLLFQMELLDRKTQPGRYHVFEAKTENLKAHFLKLQSLSREAQPLPVALLVEPTSRCNMNCVMCARSIPGHRREEECDLPRRFVSLLSGSMKAIQAARVQGLGEPLMSSSFVPLMDDLESNWVHVVTFNTNGYLLDEKMAQFLVDKAKIFEHFRISFSLDAATQKTYDRIRGKDLSRVLRNIRYLQDYRRKLGMAGPSVFINMTLSRTNIKDLPKFIRLAQELEAQVELSNLALSKDYETIRIQKSSEFMFEYGKEVLTAYPKLFNRCLQRAERLGRQMKVQIHKAGDLTPLEEPPSRFRVLTRLKEIVHQTGKSHQPLPDSSNLPRLPQERDPAFENLPLCLLPWSQMVISSKGSISLCCVQGFIDNLSNYSSLEEAWNSEGICRIREQLSQRIFPPECETADCTVRRWNTRVCVVHQ